MFEYQLLRKREGEFKNEKFYYYQNESRQDILCYCITEEELKQLEYDAIDDKDYNTYGYYDDGVASGVFNGDVVIVIYSEENGE